MTYALCMDPDMAINFTFGTVSEDQRRRWKRTIKTDRFQTMIREELQTILNDHGLTEEYTLDLLKDTIKKAKDKGDVTNLMRAVDNLQDMHGMKDKHLVKTVDRLEASETTSLIDDIRDEEKKLVATRTTYNAENGEVSYVEPAKE